MAVVLNITFRQFQRSFIEAYNTVEKRVKLSKKCCSITKSSLFLLIILDQLIIRGDLVRFEHIVFFFF